MKTPNVWMKLFQATDIIRELHDRENRGERPPLQTTLAEAKVMGCVLFSPDGCSVKEIADRLGITRGAVSQIVEKMVRKGPLVRVPDEKDRRAVRITLSRDGLERHKRLTLSFGKLTEKLLEGVPPEKIQIFAEVLDHLIASKEKIQKQETKQ